MQPWTRAIRSRWACLRTSRFGARIVRLGTFLQAARPARLRGTRAITYSLRDGCWANRIWKIARRWSTFPWETATPCCLACDRNIARKAIRRSNCFSTRWFCRARPLAHARGSEPRPSGSALKSCPLAHALQSHDRQGVPAPCPLAPARRSEPRPSGSAFVLPLAHALQSHDRQGVAAQCRLLKPGVAGKTRLRRSPIATKRPPAPPDAKRPDASAGREKKRIKR